MSKSAPNFKKQKLNWEKETPENQSNEVPVQTPMVPTDSQITVQEEHFYKRYTQPWEESNPQKKATLGISRNSMSVHALPENWDVTRLTDAKHLESCLSEISPERLVFVSDGSTDSMLLFSEMLKLISSSEWLSKLQLVVVKESHSIEDAGLSGLCRTVKSEFPEIQLTLIHSPSEHLNVALQISETITDETELEVSEDGQVFEPVLDHCSFGSQGDLNKITPESSYVISGGAGALGLETAEWLIKQGAVQIVLLSRTDYSNADKPEKLVEIQNQADVRCVCCDVTSQMSLKRALESEQRNGLLPVGGVFHVAGVLTDGSLENQTEELYLRAFDVKVLGAMNLEHVLKPKDFFIAYTSVAGVLGSLGQASYAAANSALDALIKHWTQKDRQFVAIQWGPWGEGGMAYRTGAVSRSAMAGFEPISHAMGVSAIETVLRSDMDGAVMFSPIDWSKVAIYNSLTSRLNPSASIAPAATASTSGSEHIRLVVREAVWESVGEPVSDDVPLLENGLNSLGSMSLRNKIATELNITLPSAFASEFPTIDAMVKHISLSNGEERAISVISESNDEHPILVVGAGLGGLTFAHQLKKLKVPVRIFEKNAKAGGVWDTVANTDSKLQIDSPAYDFDNNYLPIDGDRQWGRSFPNQIDIVSGANELSASLGDEIQFDTKVLSVSKVADKKYEVTYVTNGVRNQGLFSGVVSMTGGLHTPKETKLANEEDFGGHLGLGISNDTPLSTYKDADVVIVGHGAFALENMRTALENGAKHVTLLCRRRNLVLSTFCNWMLNSAEGVMPVGDVMEIMRPFYGACGVDVETLPSFVRQESGDVLLDQTTVPPGSDLFFLAQLAGKLTVVEGEIAEYRSESICTKDGKDIKADVILKCFGFKTEDTILTSMFGEEKTIEGFWINGDPNLFTYNDGAQVPRKVKSLLCSSYLFFVQCFAKAFVHFRQDEQHFNDALKRITDASSPNTIAERIFIEVWDFIEPAKRNVAERTKARLPFERFLVEREREWKEYAKILGVSEEIYSDLWQFLDPTIAIKARREPEYTSESRVVDDKFGEFSVFHTRRKSVLFLPGQGTDARLARSLLERTGWLDRKDLEFTIVDAPFSLPAFTNEEQLRQVGLDGLVELGVYDKTTQYKEWRAGFETLWEEFHGRELPVHNTKERADWAYTFGYLKKLIQEFGPFDGVAGFCEGAAVLTAALAQEKIGADHGLGDVKFFIAMSPWLAPMHVKDELFRHRSLSIPTLQVVGDNDMPVFIDAAPKFANTFTDITQYHHSGQHVYPTLTKPLEEHLDNLLNRVI
ncbi:putative Polyketide synthase type I [Vibrio nigripulchritudo SO65]|uniref:SDR family NAD(P)-dependent oxidoreductase n=1 Tax=Vibrio nigripulchritudo TaxID=28173 RepID=UPI0003B20885|nr:SDR family NAD(P)-dependent oxidoreductase [Vibrio nigripulchritudo]CCN38643.1 putative Polyketide synthase type I [Vibrio nigripulchritudo AM115]CCN44952.1 putative Polyketide synthase type I [Vibrio nigripulchritudo FTn2]CCN79707.1 putative Polyketide synthase type I [Vibrio nigripulchritudo SO65]